MVFFFIIVIASDLAQFSMSFSINISCIDTDSWDKNRVFLSLLATIFFFFFQNFLSKVLSFLDYKEYEVLYLAKTFLEDFF